ncbi:hypothetical protein [Streptomyces sp. NRRL WC-3742]|uniref:hypothetical protein n=1 Tax=Streptomyces sp. NRRL WC-3742 TaxID=1463934 RepID=UPI00131BB0E9|nr:hypothetical protein [Streptomyces sp. NRRL WC-3742]
MSGQYPGPFGPPPGGTPYVPGPPPAPAAIPGRLGTTARVLFALAPVVTFGLLGAVPSLVLAVRRRRAYDIAGAVVFCGLLLTLIVSAGIAGRLKDPTADLTGQITLFVLWFAPTPHFLLMDRREVWEAGRPAPQPSPSYAAPQAQPHTSPYAPTAPGYGAPAAPYAPPPPQAAAAPAALAAPATPVAPVTGAADDLKELGELLRRQSREGRP